MELYHWRTILDQEAFDKYKDECASCKLVVPGSVHTFPCMICLVHRDSEVITWHGSKAHVAFYSVVTIPQIEAFAKQVKDAFPAPTKYEVVTVSKDSVTKTHDSYHCDLENILKMLDDGGSTPSSIDTSKLIGIGVFKKGSPNMLYFYRNLGGSWHTEIDNSKAVFKDG